jgi:cytoskeletal protein CcmA (bactofilin family)
MPVNSPSTRLIPTDRLAAIGSLLAEGAVFEGSFQSTKDQGMKVDGLLKGNIVFDVGGTLHVGPTGCIENTRLEADYIFIEGKITGTIIARKALEIGGSATIVGDVSYDELIDIHPRAKLKGQLEYRGSMSDAP